MRKNVFGRQLKRDANERKALFKGLMSSLVLKERIKTTEEKAKAIKGQIEKLVTKAKKRGKNVRNLFGKDLMPDAIEKLINEVAPRFEKRPGGYTRIIKLGRRFSDNANMVVLEWTESAGVQSSEFRDQSVSEKVSESAAAKKTSKRNKKPATTETRKKKEAQKPKTRKRKLSVSK